MLSWERLLLVDDSNNSFVLRWINNSPTLSSVFISAVQTKDQLIKSVKESQTYNSLQANMLFTWSSVSFIFFSIIFVGASAVSSVFILPLLFLSFIFSGLVVIFSGLSYTTFKLASSKYNHTVLFLNKLLRKLADNIPPAVGFEEIQQAKQSPWKDLGLPSLRLSERFNKLYGLITYPFTKKPALETDSTPVEEQDFQVEQADSAVPVIYDDEEPNLENGIEEPLVEPTPIVDQEEKPSPPDDQPIKDSEVDSNED